MRIFRSTSSKPNSSTSEEVQPSSGDGSVDSSVAAHLSEVSNSAQQSVGDPRSASAAAGDLVRALVVDLDTEQPGRAQQDAREVFRSIEVEPMNDAKTSSQGSCDESCTSGGADQRKGRDIDLHALGRGSVTQHDIDLEILDGRVENLFHCCTETVDLIDKQDLLGLQVHQNVDEIARLLEHRARGGLEGHLHLIGDDAGQRSLA